ncbi:MAG: hypothetical protein Q4E34_06350, partial [Synergistaceae bacterium]|nr:hypothetical protein [Synergistaceae bacterium]
MTKITKSSIKRYAALFMLISFVLSVVSPALATAKIENDTTSGASGTGIRIYDDSLTGIEIPEAVGEYSVSMGYRTCSTGDYAVSMGYGTISSGYASTAMGYWSMASEYLSTAMGMATTASGRISTAMGCTTIASGEISTAMGDSTIAGGYASTATGYHSEAHGSGSFSGGGYYDVDTYDEVYGGKAYGNSSFAFGSNAVAGKIVSEAVIDPDSYNIITPAVYGGHNTFAFGSNAKAAEDNTIAFGSLSLSESAEKAYYGTYAQGVFKGEIDNEDLLGIANNLFENAIESGTRTADEINALKNAATVEAFVSGMDQFLEDIGIGMDFVTAIKSTGYVSAPEGTTASGENAIAIGNSSKVQGTLASGKNSMALGNDAQATHDNSVALGSNSVTTAENTISVGYVGGE